MNPVFFIWLVDLCEKSGTGGVGFGQTRKFSRLRLNLQGLAPTLRQIARKVHGELQLHCHSYYSYCCFRRNFNNIRFINWTFSFSFLIFSTNWLAGRLTEKYHSTFYPLCWLTIHKGSAVPWLLILLT